ncbi:MAG: hypothetical protein ABR499_05055 [Gemmatimonadaceae bacterium]
MMIRIYGLNAPSRPAAIALAAAALAVGAVFVAFGIVLLLGVAAIGTVVGAGVVVFRRLTGRGSVRIPAARFDTELDPSLEVFPEQSGPQAPAHKLASDQAHKLD